MPVTFAVSYIPVGNGKYNYVMHRPTAAAEEMLVFFPGDVTNFTVARSKDPLTISILPQCYDYSLESICWCLGKALGDRFDIFLFKPNMMLGNYSIYSNFLLCDAMGIPRWSDMAKDRSIVSPGDTFLSFCASMATGSTHQGGITLVGFSKGCVVPLGLLFEGNHRALSMVKRIVLIDPGTGKVETTFPFSDSQYADFPSDISLAVYTSPYQFSDPGRPWLKDEILSFVSKSGAKLYQVLFDHERSLDTHFKCITVALEMEELVLHKHI